MFYYNQDFCPGGCCSSDCCAVVPPLWCADDRQELRDKMCEQLGFLDQNHVNKFDWEVLICNENFLNPGDFAANPTPADIASILNPFEFPFFPEHELAWVWFDLADGDEKLLALGPKGARFSPFDYACLRPTAPPDESLLECYWRAWKKKSCIKTEQDFLPFIKDQDLVESINDGSLGISLLATEDPDGLQLHVCDVLFRSRSDKSHKRRVHSISDVLKSVSLILGQQGFGRTEINFFVDVTKP